MPDWGIALIIGGVYIALVSLTTVAGYALWIKLIRYILRK